MLNTVTREVRNKLGPFKFEQASLNDQEKRIKKGPCKLDNGAYYERE